MESINFRNNLIKKSLVGKFKLPSIDLPPNLHVYGKKNIKDEYNVGHLLTSWNLSEPQVYKSQERDFNRLNRMAVEKGIYDAKAAHEFRKDFDVMRVPRRLNKLSP